MRQSDPSFFLTKNTGAPIGVLDGQMWPFSRFLWRKSSSSLCSAGDRGNVQEQGSSALVMRSIVWSQAFHGGSLSKASLEKTSLKLRYWASTISLRGQLSLTSWASWASHYDAVAVALMLGSSHSGGMNMA